MLADDLKIDLESAPHVLVYQDATLPTVYYCASTRPSVARAGDAWQLSLVHYDRPVGDRAGMLSLVIDLRADDAEMTAAQAELARLHGHVPTMRPIPWSAGTIAVALAGGDPVLATPSLLGENAAALSLPLTTTQYLLLKEALDSPLALPLMAVYGLSFEAVRRKFDFSVHFDDSKFRDWMETKCSADFLFISVEETHTFVEMRKQGVIRIESENFTGEDPPEGFQRAFLASLKAALVPLPRFAPAPEAGGGNWLIGFSCSSVHDIQDMGRRLDLRMQVEGPVARKAYIQGSVDGLREALRAQPDEELPTGAGFTRTLIVRCHDDFGGRPLRALVVTIEGGSASPQWHEFKDPADAWSLTLLHAPGDDAGYTYRCQLSISDRRPIDLPSLPIARESAFLDIVPAALYTFRSYTAAVGSDFPWSLVSGLSLALTGPKGMEFAPARLQFDVARPAGHIDAFAPVAVNPDDVVATVTCKPAGDGGPAFTVMTLPSGSTVSMELLVPRTVTFRVQPGFDWQRCSAISIVVPPQPDNPQLWEQRRVQLSRTQPQAQVRFWYTQDRTFQYRADFKTGSGVVKTTPTPTRFSDVALAAPQTTLSN